MAEETRRRPPGIGEGIRSGIGMLTAFKEAIEETLSEAMDRGDMKPERAKQAISDAFVRAQEAVGDVRERLEWVPRKDFDELKAEVAALRRRLDALAPEPGTLIVPATEMPSEPPPAPTGGDGPVEQRMP